MTTPDPASLLTHADGIQRCWWCGSDPVYVTYHDTEWGVPEYDSRALFEKLLLDGFQAGLSWITILRKRDAFRAAFDGFDPERMACYTEAKLQALMQDTGIVRNRQKIEASVTNAQSYLALIEDQSFADYLWGFAGGAPVDSRITSRAGIPTSTPLAETISKDLKQRGFRFCGPTIVYAFMQACGLYNDHLAGCHRYSTVQALAHR